MKSLNQQMSKNILGNFEDDEINFMVKKLIGN
jgi:hypothetical protein